MYKFPVIKNGIEYGVSIDKLEIYKVGFEVKLYKKVKFLWGTINRLVDNDDVVFYSEDKKYLELLKNEKLYIFMADRIIRNYERKTYKDNLMDLNQKAFKDWNGILD